MEVELANNPSFSKCGAVAVNARVVASTASCYRGAEKVDLVTFTFDYDKPKYQMIEKNVEPNYHPKAIIGSSRSININYDLALMKTMSVIPSGQNWALFVNVAPLIPYKCTSFYRFCFLIF